MTQISPDLHLLPTADMYADALEAAGKPVPRLLAHSVLQAFDHFDGERVHKLDNAAKGPRGATVAGMDFRLKDTGPLLMQSKFTRQATGIVQRVLSVCYADKAGLMTMGMQGMNADALAGHPYTQALLGFTSPETAASHRLAVRISALDVLGLPPMPDVLLRQIHKAMIDSPTGFAVTNSQLTLAAIAYVDGVKDLDITTRSHVMAKALIIDPDHAEDFDRTSDGEDPVFASIRANMPVSAIDTSLSL